MNPITLSSKKLESPGYWPIAISADDMQIIESARFRMGDVLERYDVPAHLLSDDSKGVEMVPDSDEPFFLERQS